MPLLLLPNLLGDEAATNVYLPESVSQAMGAIDGLIAESVSGGRAYLKRFHTKRKPHDIPIALLSEDPDFLLEPVIKGETWGVVSDAGLPCIADPGCALVNRARIRGVSIEAFVGPSSILLALMQSGLPGQRFAFHGYIGKTPEARTQELKVWEYRSKQEQATQIFMEAPHRSAQTLQQVIETLNPATELCVAWDLTLPTQGIVTVPVSQWRKRPQPDIAKKPAIFLLFTEAKH